MRAHRHLYNLADYQRPHPPNRTPRVELHVLRGEARRPVREVLGPVFLIGSSSHCDLVLGDPTFPPVHPYLLVRDRGVRGRSLGFPPDVRLDEEPVEMVILNDGDRLSMDPFEFRVRIEMVSRNGLSAQLPHGTRVPKPMSSLRDGKARNEAPWRS